MRRNLVNRFFRLGNAVQSQTQNLLAEKSDLSVLNFRILLRLRNVGEQNVQAISELLGTNRSVVSRALPKLQDSGWITVKKSEHDHRKSLVSVTKAGSAIVDAHWPLIEARYDKIREQFDTVELDQLFEFLDRLDHIFSLNPTDVEK